MVVSTSVRVLTEGTAVPAMSWLSASVQTNYKQMPKFSDSFMTYVRLRKERVDHKNRPTQHFFAPKRLDHPHRHLQIHPTESIKRAC